MVKKPISKVEAKKQGFSRYYTGKPCKHGHVADRYVSNGHCRACIDARHSAWRKEFPQKTNAISRRWKNNNPEAVADYKKKYRAEFPEKHAANAVDYRKNHTEKVRALSRNYKAKKRAAIGFHTGKDISAIMDAQNCLCNACSANLIQSGFHVDHITPLSRGGSNWPSNLQILCPSCNLSKGAKTNEEWLSTLTA